LPFCVQVLGTERYGTWVLITSLTGYLTLLVLGVPMASVRYMAKHDAAQQHDRLNEVVSTCLGLYALLGALALLIGTGLLVVFNFLYNGPLSLAAEARVAFVLVIVYVGSGFIARLPAGIMMAHRDFVVLNGVALGGIVVRVGLTLGLLTWQPTLINLALVQVLCSAAEAITSWWIIRRRYPHIRPRLAQFNSGMLRQIFSFSVYVLLLNAAIQLAFHTDALVIGAALGVSAIAPYAIANSLTMYLVDFFISIGSVIMPTATRLQASGELSQLKDEFLKWSKISFSLALLAGVCLIVLGPTFIAWWIGPSFEGPSGRVLQILMLSYVIFLPVRGVSLPVLMGLGKPGFPTLAFAGASVLNLVLSLLLVRPMGLEGVALGTAIPNVLFAIVVLHRACREIDVPLLEYLRYVTARAVPGALPALALLVIVRHGFDIRGPWAMAAAGGGMLALFALTWISFVYRKDRYVTLWSRASPWSEA
jgi:O-antigen/teichoic acid export membrane protein